MTQPQQSDASPSKDGGPVPYVPLTEAKRLLRTARAGALATLTSNGGPFASLVNVATMPDGSPILLMSRLAAHTRQLECDARLSLLLTESGEGDPLAHPRLTLTGSAERADAPDFRAALRTRFLARHPKSSLYADFADFSFWRVRIELAHLNGGFGRTGNFDAASICTPIEGAQTLIAAEGEALSHMNRQHADALALYATVLTGKPDGGWRASGLDPEGLDLVLGDDVARIPFPQPVKTPAALRLTLKGLADAARGAQ